ncbi:MAG: site-specific integrase [Candidatus Aureabacteria bacterium]|nr:site-specific integrase [Candidatus Auribacterota bacterium]
MALFKKNGNWYIDYYCDLIRFRQKIGPSKKQAEQMLAIRKAAILQGRFEIKKRRKCPTLAEFSTQYLEHSKATKRSWRRDIDIIKHLNRVMGSYRLDQVTPEVVEKYKLQRRQEILSRPKYRDRDPRDVPMSTANRELACLKNMFNMAIKWGRAEKNPARQVQFYKVDNLMQRILSDEEIKALLDSCNGHLRDIVIIALNTGMRLGEILNLTWEQINLPHGYITVIKTKSGKQRQIPINGEVRKVLNGHKRDGIFVFDNNGKSFGSVKTAFHNALRRSGIARCRFHDLRHTVATKMVLAGVSLPVVKEILGHASIETTMRYAHPTPESKREAVEVLEGRKVGKDRHYMDTSIISVPGALAVTPSE